MEYGIESRWIGEPPYCYGIDNNTNNTYNNLPTIVIRFIIRLFNNNLVITVIIIKILIMIMRNLAMLAMLAMLALWIRSGCS